MNKQDLEPMTLRERAAYLIGKLEELERKRNDLLVAITFAFLILLCMVLILTSGCRLTPAEPPLWPEIESRAHKSVEGAPGPEHFLLRDGDFVALGTSMYVVVRGGLVARGEGE